MKGKLGSLIKKDIDRLRLELNSLVEVSEPGSEIVRKVSCELDKLILRYYRIQNRNKRYTEKV